MMFLFYYRYVVYFNEMKATNLDTNTFLVTIIFNQLEEDPLQQIEIELFPSFFCFFFPVVRFAVFISHFL